MKSARSSSVREQPDKQNRSLIITSWVLMGLVCLLSLIPFLGFGSWLIAGPILFIALVMGIIVVARGGTMPGVFILLASLIAAPVLILIAPFVSSLLGLSGTVGAVGSSAEVGSRANLPEELSANTATVGAADGGTRVPTSANELDTRRTQPMPFNDASDDKQYEELKTMVQGQIEQIATLKSRQLATEGVQGYLVGSDLLNLDQRRLVQQENVWREQIFGLIGERTGRSREEIADVFADMAQGSVTNRKPAPAD